MMKNNRFKRILVTGSQGFLAHHIIPALREAFEAELVLVSRADYDLLKPGIPERMLKDVQPDALVHLAAKSGGIIDNKKRPASYF